MRPRALVCSLASGVGVKDLRLCSTLVQPGQYAMGMAPLGVEVVLAHSALHKHTQWPILPDALPCPPDSQPHILMPCQLMLPSPECPACCPAVPTWSPHRANMQATLRHTGKGQEGWAWCLNSGEVGQRL